MSTLNSIKDNVIGGLMHIISMAIHCQTILLQHQLLLYGIWNFLRNEVSLFGYCATIYMSSEVPIIADTMHF
jgi:hypothetical protein